MSSRHASISRQTSETSISLDFDLDGTGKATIATGVGFLDHMLDLFTKHGLFNLSVQMKGDTHIDFHHSVEDVGICLGHAFRQALGDAAGIKRYASVLIPMDETLCQLAIDVSNRPCLVFDCPMPAAKVGDFDTELTEEFFNAFVMNARISLHVSIIRGKNTHHIIESCFKALGICLDQATQLDPRKSGIPSTKGLL